MTNDRTHREILLQDIAERTATVIRDVLYDGITEAVSDPALGDICRGAGKTTLGSRFPKPVLLDIEGGIQTAITIPSFGLLASYDNVRDAITALGTGEHGYRTVVLDSLDAFESLIWQAVCSIHSWDSIEAPGYGKGYSETDRWWRDDLLTFLQGGQPSRYRKAASSLRAARCRPNSSWPPACPPCASITRRRGRGAARLT